MKNLKTDVLGLLACLAIIAGAFVLFGYVRKHEPIVMFGYALDAIITAGIISNLIIFPLVMATRLSAFRTALWTLLLVHGGLLLIATLVGNSVDPGFRFLAVLVAYLVSFIFWLSIHWLRSQIRTATVTSG